MPTMPEASHHLRELARRPMRVASPVRRYRPDPGRHEVDGDLILIARGEAGPDFNFAVVVGPLPPEQVFARADAFFGGTTYAVAVEAETAQPTEEALRAAGWRLDEDEPALVLTPIPTTIPEPPAGLTIELVSTEASLRDFVALSGRAGRWTPPLAFVRDPAVAFFVGYVAGAPVAACRFIRYEDVGEITGVTTIPAFRRRGIGTALTWAACAEGARRGCVAMTLTASAMGYPVYVAMGFVPVCTIRTYLPPSAAPGV